MEVELSQVAALIRVVSRLIADAEQALATVPPEA